MKRLTRENVDLHWWNGCACYQRSDGSLWMSIRQVVRASGRGHGSVYKGLAPYKPVTLLVPTEARSQWCRLYRMEDVQETLLVLGQTRVYRPRVSVC